MLSKEVSTRRYKFSSQKLLLSKSNFGQCNKHKAFQKAQSEKRDLKTQSAASRPAHIHRATDRNTVFCESNRQTWAITRFPGAARGRKLKRKRGRERKHFSAEGATHASTGKLEMCVREKESGTHNARERARLKEKHQNHHQLSISITHVKNPLSLMHVGDGLNN